MGKAGRVLRQVLQSHSISKNKLAVTMDLKNGDTIVKIVMALQELNPEAAVAFVELYLGDIIKGKSEE